MHDATRFIIGLMSQRCHRPASGLTILLALLLSAPAALGGEALNVDVKELDQRLDQAEAAHPQLFFAKGEVEAIRERMESQPLLKQAYQRMRDEAEALFDAPPIKRKMTGKRLLGKSRQCLRRVSRLAFLYRMSGEARYAERAQREMVAVAGFKDWNPSHFLDVAEMTAALAIGYDWGYDALDKEARRTIRQAIVEKGLKTSFQGRGGWIDKTSNWNQVCHGGLVLGALAVREAEPELAKRVIKRALNNIHHPMNQYGPRGGYPEGPGYWRYGTSYNVALITALRSTLGSDFGMSDRPGFMRTAGYYLHTHGPTVRYFNYSDSHPDPRLAPAAFWFAAQRENPSLLWMEKRKLKRYVAGDDDPIRFLPLMFVWSPDWREMAAPDRTHRRVASETPVGLHRSGWDGKAVFAGLKGGTPDTSHGQMDIGSFVMAGDGVRWAIDLGSQNYNSLESVGIGLWGTKQDSERWQVYRLNNLSHNTLVVNGRKQRVSGHAPITDFSRKGARPHTIIDMSSVYEDQLAKAKRGLGLLNDKAVLVQDEITAPKDQPATVRWGMVTRAQVSLDGPRATLKQDGQTLTFELLSPAGAKIETYSTEPPADYDAANPGTRMVGFKVKLDPGESRTLRVRLTPGTGSASNDGASQGKPLSAW